MSSHRVLVTYTSSPLYLSTDQWQHLRASLARQFPLRTLHWKSPSRSTIQTIPELHVDFVALESLRDEPSSQVPQTLLERPLLNTYFVVCEDSELYKNSVRKQIKEWHALVSTRKNQEWLIVHIVRPEGRTAQGRIFQIKSSVLDKIKADFNTDKRDRCVQLVWSAEYEHPAVWAELITKMKEGILLAFDSAFIQREEEVRRSEGQRAMPGWNFCTFFILKESLAMSLEGMNLFENALEQYNELEASFFKVLQEKNLSWFGALISPEPTDDSVALLSVNKKRYRDLILANSISVFDFRVYLLARQCALMSKLGKIAEICEKVVAFLSGFGRRLRELEDTLPPFFVESWTYSSALSVIDQCDVWANPPAMSKGAVARLNAVKGELLELAQQQLDIIGIRTGHLPSRPPFSIALPPPNPEMKTIEPRKRFSKKISRSELLKVLTDKEAFYDLYQQITNRAIEQYANAGRRKFALRLHGNLAALDLIRGRLPSALETYKSLPAHYAPHGWTALESFMRLQALTIHASSHKERDGDWISVVLEFLKAYVDDMGTELLMDVDDHKTYIAKLVAELRSAANALESDLLYPDHPAFSLRIISSSIRLSGTQDGALLDVVVRNHLPCELAADEVVVITTGYEGVQIQFTSQTTTIPTGTSTLTLFSPSVTPGLFTLQLSRIRLSRVVLEWKEIKGQLQAKGAKIKDLPTLVRIPKDLHSLDVRLHPPRIIEVGKPSKIMAILRTGRNDVSSVTLRLSSSTGVTFRTNEATLDSSESVKWEMTDNTITFCDIAQEREVVVFIPHSDASSYHTLRVNVSVEYVTKSEPDMARKIHLLRFVTTSLPMTINVEDFFRGTRLFTRFMLSTTSHQHVRVRAADLQPSDQDRDSIKVTNCRLQKPSVMTVTPAQSGRFLFQLDSLRGKAREPLKLYITYRMLREEVESFIEAAISQVIEESPSLQPRRAALVDKLIEALSGDANWIELYGLTGELLVPNIPDEEEAVLSRLKEILGGGKYSATLFGEWRNIIIPVDVPQIHILAAAQLRVLANPFFTEPTSGRILPLYAGQPVAAAVNVRTSFHWAPNEDEETCSYILRYDVEDMTGDWLVSGRKRGNFLAKDGTDFTIPVTLIALRHGELSLPQVGITALPLSGDRRMGMSPTPSCETYQVHGAEKVLVLPRGGRTTFIIDMGHESMESHVAVTA
ncbi:uncharacterized protein LAESUDRAFT_809238 [Laetiporus sulphureus 93-53]|uniref:Trafficking protein particle complex subunit 10 n=1 Tax=Laetiporus sulphureus 93-53 TaxID=1314785 RepID=A0A165H5H4_9APHY|nr:uncharacterized protein LAESUDRAFT_809238 [Laetiporus sulphureus 93-53]KZT11270.1 hypothetical protein LAESUDRAFT_809238 [Laetiporus sulphureus 93-53]